MNRVMWGIGWCLDVVGAMTAVVWPVMVALGKWREGELPHGVEWVYLAVMVVIGVGLVVVGRWLRRSFAI